MVLDNLKVSIRGFDCLVKVLKSILIVSLLLGGAFSLMRVSTVRAEIPSFEQRKQAWLDRNGSDVGGGYDARAHYGRSYMFAWLEKGLYSDPTSSGLGSITDILHGGIPAYDEGLIAHNNNAGTIAGLNLLRLLLQYGDQLTSQDRDSIHQAFREKVTDDFGIVSRMGAVGSTYSTQPQRTTEAYLYTSIHYPDAEFYLEHYDDWTADCPGCSGTTYQVGNKYNTHQFTEDLLINGMQNWVSRGNSEFDGNYAHLITDSMLLLYDFAQDPAMKARAKMVLDLVYLDQAMDYSGGQKGGSAGRNYILNILDSRYLDFTFYELMGLGLDRYGSRGGHAYVTTYRVPNLIQDVVHVDEESDDYWHIQKERNDAGFMDGKWTYVTPYYTLGMAESPNTNWQLTITTSDWGPFKLWMDKDPDNGDSSSPETEWGLGWGPAVQYKNAILLYNSADHLHVYKENRTFDEGEGNLIDQNSGWENDYHLANSSWNFFREGKTAIALMMTSSRSALEVAVIGVDYPSFDAFKTAISNNASLSSGVFTTSRGDVLQFSSSVSGGLVNGQPIWSFPFERMEAESSLGKIIDWNSNEMTVSKNGLTCSYDFNNWIYSGNGCGSELPPIPTFGDVPFDHPYHDEIEVLYQEGYVAGCSVAPRLYCPDQTMTRAESAVFVDRGNHGAAFDPQDPTEKVFDDVALDAWHADWVHQLWEDGYTSGCGTDPLVYCPYEGHTRTEGCVFFLRMLYGVDYEPPAPQGIFTDVPLDWWGTKWIEAAYNAGLITACETSPELKFCPEDGLTRAVAAYMMVQAKGLELP
jgi:hypothetical protein